MTQSHILATTLVSPATVRNLEVWKCHLGQSTKGIDDVNKREQIWYQWEISNLKGKWMLCHEPVRLSRFFRSRLFFGLLRLAGYPLLLLDNSEKKIEICSVILGKLSKCDNLWRLTKTNIISLLTHSWIVEIFSLYSHDWRMFHCFCHKQLKLYDSKL